jgi:hypothetical protein
MRRLLKGGGTVIIGGDKITSQEQLDQKGFLYKIVL